MDKEWDHSTIFLGSSISRYCLIMYYRYITFKWISLSHGMHRPKKDALISNNGIKKKSKEVKSGVLCLCLNQITTENNIYQSRDPAIWEHSLLNAPPKLLFCLSFPSKDWSSCLSNSGSDFILEKQYKISCENLANASVSMEN